MASFETSRQEIESIVRHLECVERERALLEAIVERNIVDDIAIKATELSELGALTPGRRRIVYSATVVALYGAFEKFVEREIDSYAAGFPGRIGEYAKLRDSVRVQHLRLSLDLAARQAKENFRAETSVPQIITNLATCIGGTGAYVVNSEAFKTHFGNIRTSKLNELFSATGIDNIAGRVVNIAPFSEWVKREVEADRLIARDASKLALLDELVERRNEVAHGQPSEILSVDLIRRFANFLLALTESISLLVADSEVADGCLMRVPLGQPLRVLKARNVVLFDVENCVLKIGDRLLVRRSALSKGLRYAVLTVQSMQVGNRNKRVVRASKKKVQLGLMPREPVLNGEYFAIAGDR